MDNPFERYTDMRTAARILYFSASSKNIATFDWALKEARKLLPSRKGFRGKKRMAKVREKARAIRRERKSKGEAASTSGLERSRKNVLERKRNQMRKRRQKAKQAEKTRPVDAGKNPNKIADVLNSGDPDDMLVVSGKTYAYRRGLKDAGGKWNPSKKTWTVRRGDLLGQQHRLEKDAWNVDPAEELDFALEGQEKKDKPKPQTEQEKHLDALYALAASQDSRADRAYEDYRRRYGRVPKDLYDMLR